MRRHAFVLAGIVALSCSGAPPPAATPVTPGQAETATPTAEPTRSLVGTLTLADGKCDFQGTLRFRAGKVAFSSVNSTRDRAQFNLLAFRTDRGGSFEATLAPLIERDRAHIASNQPIDGIRGLDAIEVVNFIYVDSGATGQLIGTITPREYAVVCVRMIGNQIIEVYGVGPIQVTD